MALLRISYRISIIPTKAITESPIYSLSFDESLNAVMQSCQMDVGIRHWDDVKNFIQTRYFDSKFLSNAEMLFEKVKESLTELDKGRSFQLSINGSSVN